jgi:hypothetical protein
MIQVPAYSGRAAYAIVSERSDQARQLAADSERWLKVMEDVKMADDGRRSLAA